MTRRSKLTLVLYCFLLCFSETVYSAQTTSSPTQAKGSAANAPPAQPVMAQMTNIPYFTLRDGMSSVLTLNNVGPVATPVSVTIYSMDGKAFTLAPITLGSHSVTPIDLSTVIPGDEFSAGNIQIAYTGISMGVTAQVSVSLLEKRVSFESREPLSMQDMGEMMSSSMTSNKLGGLVLLPQPQARGFLAVTNIGANTYTVQVFVGPKRKSITLNPRQTQLLDLNDDFSQKGPVASLVTLQYDGTQSDIVTSGFVLDLLNGYSSAFTMVDPSFDTSSHLAGAHLRIGEPDPSEGFPLGTKFRSPLLLGNLGDKIISARVLLDYKFKSKVAMTLVDPSKSDATETNFGTLSVGNVIVPPGGVKQIELSDFVSAIGGGPIVEAGVDVDYDAPPGTLLGQLVSVDQTGDYSFEVPIKDAAASTEGMEGIYPWTLHDGTKTIIHLKNATDNPVSALMTIVYHDSAGYEAYRLPEVSLRPYETFATDIQEIIDSKTPDLLGHTIPTSVTSGQFHWHQITPYSMIGRAEKTDVERGIASSFSCNLDCCANYNATGAINVPNTTGDVGQNVTKTSVLYGVSCNGDPFGPNPNSNTSGWASSDTTIATASSCSGSSCTVNNVGGGQATISADATIPHYVRNGGACVDQGSPSPLSTTVTVTGPDHVKVISDSGGFAPQCPSTGLWYRLLTVQLVDASGNNINDNLSVAEGYTNLTTNTCGNGTPVPSSCAPTVSGGQWTDGMAVSGNLCGSGISQSSGCGYSLTSTWSMCSNHFSNSPFSYNGVTLSNSVSVNGNTSFYSPGTQLY